MKQLSICRDLDKSVKCSLWYDEVIGSYAVFAGPGHPAHFTYDEQEAWNIYRATMIHGTNGFGGF